MDANLVDYLLNTLDPASRADMDNYLRSHPEVQQRLTGLRRTLEVLAVDRGDPELPADLSVRTLERVSAYQNQSLPYAPRVARGQSAGPTGRPWRRLDVAVAAAILVCVGLLVPTVLHRFHHQHQITTCTNNLHQFGNALLHYSDLNPHPERERGTFPNVARQLAPRNVPGSVVPLLMEAGTLPSTASVRCPGNGTPLGCPLTYHELLAMPPEQFNRFAPQLLGCYAYTLGYLRNGQVLGFSNGDGLAPIMSDGPPAEDSPSRCGLGNSSNHRGRGQNVLYADGSVRFLNTHIVNGDDFFRNRNNQVAPGLDRGDSVLGRSDTQVKNPVNSSE